MAGEHSSTSQRIKWKAVVKAKKFDDLIRVHVDGKTFPIRANQQLELEKWAAGDEYDKAWLHCKEFPKHFVTQTGECNLITLEESAWTWTPDDPAEHAATWRIVISKSQWQHVRVQVGSEQFKLRSNQTAELVRWAGGSWDKDWLQQADDTPSAFIGMDGTTNKLVLLLSAWIIDDEEDAAAAEGAPSMEVDTVPKLKKKHSLDVSASKADEPAVKKTKPAAGGATETTTTTMVKAIKKGSAVLDKIWCDSNPGRLGDWQVHEEGEDVFDAMLTQTNLGVNKNKYYIIQLLRHSSKPSFEVFCRYGRVGYDGVNSALMFSELCKAKEEFTKKFQSKSGNDWDARHDFVVKAGRYSLIKMDYSAPETEAKPAVVSGPPIEIEPCKLHPKLQEIVATICDVAMMQEEMEEVGYDSSKMPLGKLSKDAIMSGYKVLKKIAQVLDDGPSGSELMDLSGEFFTSIPHAFGMAPMIAHIINDKDKLKKKLKMVESLADIVVAHKLLASGTHSGQHALDTSYGQLKCKMEVVEKSSDEYGTIEAYLQNTHAPTHCDYTMELETLVRMERDGEAKRFEKFAGLGNRQLLWHGSGNANWAGILLQGLRIAPPEAPSTGYMFDKGVYFADMSSKSANYCRSSKVNNRGFLLLGEVALGNMHEMKEADREARTTSQAAGHHSVKGLGKTGPNPEGQCELPNGCIVPSGKPCDTGVKGTELIYNEFVVYDQAQVQMRYMLQIKFKYK